MLLKAQLGALCLQFEKLLLSVMQRVLFQSFSEAGAGFIDRIVVFRVGNLGDTVVAMPALYTLRQAFPKARITLLTSSGQENLPGAMDVLSPFVPLVDDVVSYLPEELKTPSGIQALKAKLDIKNKIDLFVSLPVSMQTFKRAAREMLFARNLGCRFAVGFNVIFPDFFRYEYINAFPARTPKTSDWLLSLIQTSLHKYASTRDYLNTEESEAVLEKKNFWKKLNLSSEKPLLLVNAGAKLPIKQWPAKYFADVIKTIRKQYPEVQVGLLGSPDEQGLNEEIRLLTEQPYVENLCAKLSLPETTLLMSRADVVLSNDTGTMHLAGILNKPVLAIFSGQFPQPLWHPPGDSCVSLSKPVSCSPCLLQACMFEDQICLTQITPERVLQALTPLLEKSLEARRQFLEFSGNS